MGAPPRGQHRRCRGPAGDRSTGQAGTPALRASPRVLRFDWAAPAPAGLWPRPPRSLHLWICLLPKIHFDPQIHTQGFSKSFVDTRRAVRFE